MSVDVEIQELELVITHLDTCYEAGDDCIHPITNKLVTDPEYDLIRKRLESLAPQSAVLKQVTASNLNAVGVGKIKHNPPMTSISKAIGSLADRTATLEDWLGKIKAELNYADPAAEVVQAYKRDGVAISIYYEKGKLKSAGLRPRDGVNGEDVTANIRFVEGVPTELWEHDRDGKRVRFLPVSCIIRGEIECKKSVFRKIAANWQAYGLSNEPANPRNYAAGSIRQFTDPTVTKTREISFTGYSILGWTSADPKLATAPYKTEVERAKYSNAVLRIPFVQVRPYRQKDLQVLEDLAPSLDYEVDGIVLSVNNLEDSEQMGTHGNQITGNPKGKIAWKFAEESAIVTVKKYEFTPGRTGKLTPVLSFDAVPLDGTQVSQCTGHSLGFMDGTSTASLGEIGVGAKIRIIKSGKIIPKVIEIVSPGQKFRAPAKCPSCSGKLEIRQGGDGKDIVCNNEFCGDRAVARLCHYLTTVGVKGLGDSIVGTLYTKKLVKYPADFYKLTFVDFKNAGFSERESILALAQIWMIDDPAHKDDADLLALMDTFDKVTIPAWKVFASQGISGAGKAAGQSLVSHYGSLDGIRNATVAELEATSDVGSVTANSIVGYFAKYGKQFDELLKFVIPEAPKKGKFTGKNFVFTGGFPGGKAKWEKEVMDRGGKCGGSVSKTTNFVVVGTDAGSKEEKAKQLGIKRVSLAELENMLK